MAKNVTRPGQTRLQSNAPERIDTQKAGKIVVRGGRRRKRRK